MDWKSNIILIDRYKYVNIPSLRFNKTPPHHGSHLYMVMGTSIHLIQDKEAKNFANHN